MRGLDEVAGAFRPRRLDHQEFPYVFLDATYLHVRDNHHVTSKAVVIATGVRADGHREILGLDVGDSEDEVFWRGFLRSLRTRVLAGVKLVISDQHAGLVNAIGRCFQGAAHQRCRFDFARNLLASVPKGQHEMVAVAFRTVLRACHQGGDLRPAGPRGLHVRRAVPQSGQAHGGGQGRSAGLLCVPPAQLRQLWSTHPLERLNRELKRRCRVVGIFPNEAAVIRLGGAVLIDIHDEWVSAERRYFSEGSMAKVYGERDNDDATVGALEPAD